MDFLVMYFNYPYECYHNRGQICLLCTKQEKIKKRDEENILIFWLFYSSSR
jgi:hypothetical protein